MKYNLGLLAIICVLLFTGCGAQQLHREECLKAGKELYAGIKDDTITSCVIEYAEKYSDILHTYCVTKDNYLYTNIFSLLKPGDEYYDTYYNSYKQIKDEVVNHVDGYYTYEFQADELK